MQNNSGPLDRMGTQMTREEFMITCRAFLPDIEFRERSEDGWLIINTEAIYIPVMPGIWHEGRFRYTVTDIGKIEVTFGALILENAEHLVDVLRSFKRTGALTGNGMVNLIISRRE